MYEELREYCIRGHKLEEGDRFPNGTCKHCQSLDRRRKTAQRQLIKLNRQQLELGRMLQGASEDLRELILRKRNILDLLIEAKTNELIELQAEAEWTFEFVSLPPDWTWSKLTKRLEEVE